LANCAMCHAKSVATHDPVRGRIPSPTEALPPPVQYYDNQGGIFVRADVTYLQQDFSVPQPVAKPGPWPINQRYDYVIRVRPLSTQERNARRAQREQAVERMLPREEDYDQREAVLFALRELTGKDAGSSTAAWQRVVERDNTSSRRP